MQSENYIGGKKKKWNEVLVSLEHYSANTHRAPTMCWARHWAKEVEIQQ